MARPHSTEAGRVLRSEERDQPLLRAAQGCLGSWQDGHAPSKEEKQAMEQLFAEFLPLLRCFVAGRGVRGADADDCLQEACVRILEGLAGFHSDGKQRKLCSWMYKIVCTQAAKMRRDRKQQPTESLGPEVEATLACEDAGPDAECEQHERQEAVRQLLKQLRARLPKLTYRVFHKHWIGKKSVQEIASEMHVTPNQVSCRLHRAKEQCRKLAERRFPGLCEHLHRWGGGNRSLGPHLRRFSASPRLICRVFRCGFGVRMPLVGRSSVEKNGKNTSALCKDTYADEGEWSPTSA